MAAKPLIYLVDDRADYRFLVEQVFNRFLPQYALRSFDSGTALCRHLDQQAGPDVPNLVLMDMQMPGLNGLQTLQHIRRCAPWPLVPVVMMTTQTAPDEQAACYEAGASAFVPKPDSLPQLHQTLRVICQYWLELNQQPTVPPGRPTTSLPSSG